MTQVDPVAESDYGRLEAAGDRAIVRYTRRLRHPRDKVWRALTEDEHLQAWFPTTIEGERAAGAPLTFHFREVGLPPMTGEVLAYEPASVLEITWGEDVLRFELEPDGDETVLTLIATMAELGKASRDGTGWHLCLTNLAHELAGEQAAGTDGHDWRHLNRAYIARFGAKASTLGPPQQWQDRYGEA